MTAGITSGKMLLCYCLTLFVPMEFPIKCGTDCDAHAFYVFAVFKNLKSLFSEDNMPVHALDIFYENAYKMV